MPFAAASVTNDSPMGVEQPAGAGLGLLEGVARAKRRTRLPVVLTGSWIARLPKGLDDTQHLMAALLYGTGMRLMECVRLGVQDVDLEYRQLVVRNGKG